MLLVKNLNLSYPNCEASLKNIHFHVEDGECLLLTGLSGCGKSSIINAINGIAKNYDECTIEGEVLYNGRNLLDEKIYEIASLISSVFQNPKTHFFNVDTTRELVFYLENIGIKREEMQKRISSLLTVFPIAHLLDRSIFDLSGGEKQILCIASAYISGNRIIVLDEPSSNLDEKYTSVLSNMLKILKEKGITLIIAEHRLYYLSDIVDKVLLIKEGVIEREFTQTAFFNESPDFLSRNGLRSLTKAESAKPLMRHAERKEKDEVGKEHAKEGGSTSGTASDCENTLEKNVLSRIPSNALFIKHFSYRFTHTRALEMQGLSFSCGKMYGIIGKNGCGKSTFIKSLIGLLKESKEEIYFNGKKLSKNARIKLSALVMQDVNHQLFTDSVENELLLNNEEAAPEVDGVLERLSLLPYKEKHPMSLSGGQKQRVAIAQVALFKRKLIFFDEPTSGMDYKHMTEIAALITSLKRNDNIIFVISHDTEFLNLAVDEVMNVEEWGDRAK